MKTIFKTVLAFFLITPICMFAQDDTENAAGVVFITGNIKIDSKGTYLESSDCAYTGNYYLGGVLSEDTGDKKANKKNKKANKKVAKNVAKTTKKVNKAKGKVLQSQEIKCTINEETRVISPIKMIGPMFKPVATGLSPACDLTLAAIYLLYLETERIKTLCRVISWKSVTSEDAMEENLTFYDSPKNGCKEIGMDQLKNKSAEIKDVINQANTAVLLNIAAVAIVLANTKTIKAEINAGNPMQKIAGLASLAQAVAFQVRLVNDNKRLKDRIKECKGIMEMVDKL